jgi:hypothetical protein
MVCMVADAKSRRRTETTASTNVDLRFHSDTPPPPPTPLHAQRSGVTDQKIIMQERPHNSKKTTGGPHMLMPPRAAAASSVAALAVHLGTNEISLQTHTRTHAHTHTNSLPFSPPGRSHTTRKATTAYSHTYIQRTNHTRTRLILLPFLFHSSIGLRPGREDGAQEQQHPPFAPQRMVRPNNKL